MAEGSSSLQGRVSSTNTLQDGVDAVQRQQVKMEKGLTHADMEAELQDGWCICLFPLYVGGIYYSTMEVFWNSSMEPK